MDWLRRPVRRDTLTFTIEVYFPRAAAVGIPVGELFVLAGAAHARGILGLLGGFRLARLPRRFQLHASDFGTFGLRQWRPRHAADE